MELLTDQKTHKRLIVLMPGYLADNTDLAHKIHWMADQDDREVLYLVQVDDDENRLAVSRRMATMKAVTSANRLVVKSKLTETANSLRSLREISCPGDVIVCQEEQTAVNGFYKTVPVSDFLSTHLNTPISTISGFYDPDQTPAKKWLFEIFSLFGFLVIIAVFTWLEIRLDMGLPGSLGTTLVAILFCIELGAVWAWYKFTYWKI